MGDEKLTSEEINDIRKIMEVIKERIKLEDEKKREEYEEPIKKTYYFMGWSHKPYVSPENPDDEEMCKAQYNHGYHISITRDAELIRAHNRKSTGCIIL